MSRYLEVVGRKIRVAISLAGRAMHLAREEGIGAGVRYGLSTVRVVVAGAFGPKGPRRCNVVDSQYGTDTAENVKLDRLDIESPNYRYGIYYRATNFPILVQILERLAVRHDEYTFVDYGSGKGLVLLKAAEYPFKKVVGIEFARELHETACRNVERYPAGLLKSKIDLLHMDAVKFMPPPGNLILYLYEPFEAPVTQQVIACIRALSREKRDIVVAYVWSKNPRVTCKPLWDAETFLGKIHEGDCWTIYRAIV